MDESEFFERALRPDQWTVDHLLHTPTFEARLQADGTLYLRGAALHEGFSVEAVQALARFLAEHVTLPELVLPDDLSGFPPQQVDFDNEDIC